MLDVWRVSRIASHDILKGDAATGTRTAIAGTDRFLFIRLKSIGIFVLITYILDRSVLI